jgi:hypothetical protein
MKYPWNFATPFALFPKSRLALATCHPPARKAGLRAVIPGGLMSGGRVRRPQVPSCWVVFMKGYRIDFRLLAE